MDDRRATSEDTRQARALLREIVAAEAERLVAVFYDTFLADPEAAAFLSHAVVEKRLRHSLHEWLLSLLAPQDEAGFAERQTRIGEVHARIRIPIQLVLQGATLLKTHIARRVAERGLSGGEVAEALILLDERVDQAMRLMSASYFSGTRRGVQVDEAYRLFSLGQDIGVEREAQRAALMEWAQGLLFGLIGGEGPPLATIAGSSFGLWVRHRAVVLFEGLAGLAALERAMAELDQSLLPRLEAARRATAEPAARAAALARFHALVEEVKFLLGDLFQTTSGLEAGRDPLTRTLNRKFLPAILGREVALASAKDTPLALLMLDIDHFKRINDRWGHSAGDLVLRQVAEVVLDAVRLSDFVFRYGGEEFLVLLVETAEADARDIAERIRRVFSAQRFRLPDGGELQATVSIGVAAYRGHPDYLHLIDRADQALLRAKQAGRDRVEVAEA